MAHAVRHVSQGPRPGGLQALWARGARGEGTPLARGSAGAGGRGGDAGAAGAISRRHLGARGRRLATAGCPLAPPPRRRRGRGRGYT
eukprot:6181278-Pleurochrysis_carterae.AAC.2